MRDTDELEKLVSDLIDIAEGYNPRRLNLQHGLCLFIERSGAFVSNKAELYMQEWPLSTNDCTYPVPHPNMRHERAYNVLEDLYTGRYGDNRRALAGYIAMRLIEDYDL